VLFVAGGCLLLARPAVIGVWPWALAPYNLRFVGALYTAALVAAFLQARPEVWMHFCQRPSSSRRSASNAGVSGEDDSPPTPAVRVRISSREQRVAVGGGRRGRDLSITDHASERCSSKRHGA